MQIDQNKIEQAIIEQAVTELVNSNHLNDRVRKAVDARIDTVFAKSADEQISSAINAAIQNGFDREYCRMSAWGEKVGEPTTIRKELEKVIGDYWNVKVDSTGKPSSGYGSGITRAEWVMSKIVADDFNAQMKQHIINVAGGLKDHLRHSLHETVNELLSGVFKVGSIDDQKLKRTGSACIDPKVNDTGLRK